MNKKPKLKIRKKEVYFKCMGCDKGMVSFDSHDWISDDGYYGLCSSCWDESLNNEASGGSK